MNLKLQDSLLKSFWFALALFALAIPGFAQTTKRDYGDGPLKWEEDFKLKPAPANSPYDAAVQCQIELVTPTEQGNSSTTGVPKKSCIECKNCRPNQPGKKQFKIKKGKACRVKVKATITTSESWVKPGKDSDELLSHEQGHFDLWEITARAAEKRINDEWHCIEALNCSVDGMNSFRAYIDTIMNEELAKGSELNEKYDEETNHSQNEEKQKEWDEKIKKLLAIKGGPTWDQINGSASKPGGNKARVLNFRNLPTTQVSFSEAILENIPWANGPVILEFPPMILEDHGGQFSRLWADGVPPVIEIYDEFLQPVGFVNFSAFFANEDDTEFTTFLSGPTEYETDDAFGKALPDQTELPPAEEEDIPLATQLTIRFTAPLGDLLAATSPGRSFDCKYEIGLAPGNPHPGDVNYDGFVDDNDIEPLKRAIYGLEVLILPQTGDLNGDLVVDDLDLELLLDILNR